MGAFAGSSVRSFLRFLAAGAAVVCGVQTVAAQGYTRPNIVLIMADDMGFSDIGCYGGEIATPTLDTLAAHGVRFTQFYNGARCCPTRASLLTGLYAHQAGQGYMTTDQSATQGPGYTGGLNKRCVTIAEVLKSAGYATLMSGKWHVVTDADKPGSDKSGWPRRRGFDRFFGTIHGGANYFTGINNNDLGPVCDTVPVTAHPSFYLTDDIGDTAVKYIAEHLAANNSQPFFLYAAFTAPHWPLHALKEDIDTYRTRYTTGWDALRPQRHERLKQLGIIDPAWQLYPEDAPAWNSLSAQDRDTMALKMAIYAAQVDRLDRNIGKIVEQLRTGGCLDNTVIVFLSDNGGCAEGGNLGWGPNTYLETKLGWNVSYGQGWAHASNTPFSLYKHYTREGGISTPFVVHWPAGIANGGRLIHQPGHIIDVMPTLVELAKAQYPGASRGYLIPPMEGVSLVSALSGGTITRTAPLFWEHEGNKAMRDGKWKILSNDGNPWRLFDMESDRTELHDLAGTNSARVAAMDAAWQAWAQRAFVLRQPVTIPTALRLVSPSGGEQWEAGTGQEIVWGCTTDTLQFVRIFYSVDGAAWQTVVDEVPHTGSHIWNVPAIASSNVMLRIISKNGRWADTCDAPFSILPATRSAIRPASPLTHVQWRIESDRILFFDLPAHSRIRMYDMAGRCVAHVPVSGGRAQHVWEGGAQPRSGVQVVSIAAGECERRFSMVRLR